MRIGVVSDTHGKADLFRKALEQMGKIELLIHAGDHYQDAVNMGREKGIQVVAVGGNCDWSNPGPAEEEITIMGFRIMVTHGHMLGVKSGNRQLIEKLRKGNYHLIIYGHSHVPEITCLPNGYLLNPGSVSSPRQGSKRSYGIVEVTAHGLIPYIHDLKW